VQLCVGRRSRRGAGVRSAFLSGDGVGPVRIGRRHAALTARVTLLLSTRAAPTGDAALLQRATPATPSWICNATCASWSSSGWSRPTGTISAPMTRTTITPDLRSRSCESLFSVVCFAALLSDSCFGIILEFKLDLRDSFLKDFIRFKVEKNLIDFMESYLPHSCVNFSIAYF
jgi:hypothetical protein